MSFNVAAVGNLPLSYQWQKNGVNLTDACNLSGSATGTLVISNVTEANNGTYTRHRHQRPGSTSAAAVLTPGAQEAACTSLTRGTGSAAATTAGTPNGLAQGTNGDSLWHDHIPAAASGPGHRVQPDHQRRFYDPRLVHGHQRGQSSAAPVQGADGNFYGTTFYGGAVWRRHGFDMTADGALTNLYSFTGAADGAYPLAPLVQGADGNFYGTTTAGGVWLRHVSSGSLRGAFTNLYSFTGGVDGKSPRGAGAGRRRQFLRPDTRGGASGKGNVFRITPGGALTTLYSFTGGTDGNSPAARWCWAPMAISTA